MQRNYPRMFSPTDDQDKDGFQLENVGPAWILAKNRDNSHDTVPLSCGNNYKNLKSPAVH